MFIAVPSFVCQFSELHTCALFFDVVCVSPLLSQLHIFISILVPCVVFPSLSYTNMHIPIVFCRGAKRVLFTVKDLL